MELLYTKLFIPSLETNIVRRTRLIDCLNKGLPGKLTLVSSLAGSGKTTLLSEWVHQVDREVAWYSLDQDDNNPIRFWQYIITAFRRIDESLGQVALAAFNSVTVSTLTDAIGIFINDLSAGKQSYLLVFDDYHAIKTEIIHKSLNYLLDHIPPHLHIAIATREDPPLLLAKRRGLSEINEIRIKDLSFTMEETSEFLNEILELHILPEALETLAKKTEGWIVGIKMAALSLKQHHKEDHPAIIKYLTGDDRYIVEYLLQEILEHQDKEIQQFLLETSILERFTGKLCDAVTGRTDGQAILDFLEKSNLFIIPLDNKGCWYRYHHLFAELLQKQLYNQMDKKYIYSLYEKACTFCKQNGLILEAINYAFASSHFESAIALLEQHLLKLFFQHEITLINSWLKLLPAEILFNHALLLAVYANTETLLSNFSKEMMKQAEIWLDQAEKMLVEKNQYEKGNTGTLSYEDVIGFISNFRGYLSRIQGDPPGEVLKKTRQTLDNLPEGKIMYRAALYVNMGFTYLNMGDDDSALQVFSMAKTYAEQGEDLFNLAAAGRWMAFFLKKKGFMKQALDICRECISYYTHYTIKKNKPQMISYMGVLKVSLAEILFESNNLEEAEMVITEVLPFLESVTGYYDSFINACIISARIQFIKGEKNSAFYFLEKTKQLRPKSVSLINAWECRFRLMQTDTDKNILSHAVLWAKTNSGMFTRENYMHHIEDFIQHTYFRYLITRKRIEKDFDISGLEECIDSQLSFVRDKKWIEREMDLLILRSLFLDAIGEREAAVNVVKNALLISEQAGYARYFLDEGLAMKNLLRNAFAEGITVDFTNRLLKAFMSTSSDQTDHAGKQYPGTDRGLLTTREIEILKLIALGKSNQRIAEQLFVSVDTIKKHLTHIYEKLGVKNRTEAAAYARNTGLLP